jgi:hypothetical protein
MKQIRILASAVVALSVTGLAAGVQAADTRKCYQLAPDNADVLELVFQDKSFGHQLVYGNWVNPGTYTLPVTGAYDLDTGSTTVRRLSVVGTIPPTQTTNNGNMICGLDGIPGGAWELQCAGAATPWANSGALLEKVACGSVPPSASGRAALSAIHK